MGGLPGNGPAVIQPLLSLSFVQQRNGALFSTEPLPFLNFAFVLFVIIIDPTTAQSNPKTRTHMQPLIRYDIILSTIQSFLLASMSTFGTHTHSERETFVFQHIEGIHNLG
mmetsp:Transcript_51251/g.57271  ORF Transcript_51251/g.57271 Transcript_51251/m.57271 type:complete len:111 (-) Transcript_51251:144-476(-)